MRFWTSWIVSDDDYRPLTYPPNESILGWWCSGYDDNDNATICGLVQADGGDKAWKSVLKDWPGVKLRFMEHKPDDYIVSSDRFPLSGWMADRMATPAPPATIGA